MSSMDDGVSCKMPWITYSVDAEVAVRLGLCQYCLDPDPAQGFCRLRRCRCCLHQVKSPTPWPRYPLALPWRPVLAAVRCWLQHSMMEVEELEGRCVWLVGLLSKPLLSQQQLVLREEQ